MITTVTLNPCIDQQFTVAGFTRGGMNRVTGARRDPAGKGINVSAALKGLGVESRCTGFNFSENGRVITDYLDGLGIAHDFVYAGGAVRTNVKLLESDTHIMTEINQPGAYVPPEVQAALFDKIKGAETLVLSGSRPQGVDADIYARIIARSSARIFLDAEGEALRLCLTGGRPKPYLIKPNLFELESAFGVKLPQIADVVAFCTGLTGGGLEYICVSMGADGAALICEGAAYYAGALDIPVRGVQGAGDAMVAGMLWALEHGKQEADILRSAVAAASASVAREGTQMCERDGFDAMYGRVAVAAVRAAGGVPGN